MYSIPKICCTCLNADLNNLTNINSLDTDSMSYYHKLKSCVPIRISEEMDTQEHYMCQKCCTTVNQFYIFQKTCMESKTVLESNAFRIEYQKTGDTNQCNLLKIINDQSKEDISIDSKNHYIKQERTENYTFQTNISDVSDDYHNKEIFAEPLMKHKERCTVKKEFGEDNNKNDVRIFEKTSENTEISEKTYILKESPLCCSVDRESYECENEDTNSRIESSDNEDRKELDNTCQGEILSKKFNCNLCELEFTRKRQLRIHIKDKHANDKPFECTICDKRFVEKNMLTKHIKNHSDERPHSCDVCNKAFKSRSNLNKHKKLHGNSDLREMDKKYQCETCGRKFRDKTFFVLHVRSHTGEKPFQCDSCEMRFAAKGQLVSHIKYKHIGEKSYACEMCDKKFMYKSNLNQHFKVHTNERAYSCDICEKRFVSKYTIFYHKKTHEGDLAKKHVCDVCNARFMGKKDLERHIRTHSGEKPFSCEFCGMNFAGKREVTVHISYKHTTEKPHGCNVCGKRYVERSALNYHMASHSEERPFDCDLCNKSFKRRHDLMQHKRLHSKDKLIIRRRNVSVLEQNMHCS